MRRAGFTTMTRVAERPFNIVLRLVSARDVVEHR
jgi:hypothetical protein